MAPGDYSGLMTYRTVSFHEIPDRYAAQTLAMADRLAADADAAEAAHEWAVSEFGEDYEQNEREDEDRDLIPESWVSLVSEQDREDLQTVLDWEDFGGFHNP